MKKVILLLTSFIFCHSIFAQYNHGSATNEKMPQLFANLSSGINNTSGLLGIGIDARVSNKALIGLGLGLSSWGTKSSLKGLFFTKEDFLGSAFGLSLNYNSGFEVLSNSTTTLNINNKAVFGKFSPAVSTNLIYGRYWQVAKRARFFINTGLAFKFQKPAIDMYYLNNGIKVTNSDDLNAAKLLSPGGLMFSGGFLIRLNRDN